MTGRTSPRPWLTAPWCDVAFLGICLWTFLLLAAQPTQAGLCSVGEVLMSCDRRFLRPKGNSEVFMKAVTGCLEAEKLDLKKIDLPCFKQEQVDTLVKCRCEAYIKATGTSSDAKKKTKSFKNCVAKAIKGDR